MSRFSIFNKTIKFEVKWTVFPLQDFWQLPKQSTSKIAKDLLKIQVRKDELYIMAWIFKAWCLQGILRITESKGSVRTSFPFLWPLQLFHLQHLFRRRGALRHQQFWIQKIYFKHNTCTLILKINGDGTDFAALKQHGPRTNPHLLRRGTAAYLHLPPIFWARL